MRKLLFPILVGVLLLVLAACGGDSDGEAANGGESSVDDGKVYELQVACVNRTFLTCGLTQDYFAAGVAAATNGRVKVEISSYPELGLAGPDTLRLIEDGTLGLPEIYPGVGNQQKWDTFVKERSGGDGGVLGLPEQAVVAFALG